MEPTAMELTAASAASVEAAPIRTILQVQAIVLSINPIGNMGATRGVHAK